MIKRIALAVGICLFAAGLASAEAPKPPAARVADLAARHDCALFAALHALPETRAVFEATLGADEAKRLEAMRPKALSDALDADTKARLLAAVKVRLASEGDADATACAERLEAWCHVSAQMTLLADYRCASWETILAALYTATATRPEFDAALKCRGMSADSVTPASVGQTLAGAEGVEIYYAAVDHLSALDERGRLEFFSQVYAYLTAQAPASKPAGAPAA